MSRQTVPPTLHWWQQQYGAGRWCQAAGVPGDAVFCLPTAPPVRLCCHRYSDRTGYRQRPVHDSASLEEAARTLGCLLDCG